MIEKRDILRYGLIILIGVVLISILSFFKGGLTGYAVFEDSESDFDLGSYVNTSYNGSGIVLVGGNLSGGYISQIFNAGNDARWDNISVVMTLTNIEYLFAADDNADVWKSNDPGVNWILVRDDYNNGDGNGAKIGFFNSTKGYFIVFNQKVWMSSDLGVSWTNVNSDYNGAEGQNAFAGISDKNDNLYIIEGDEDVWKSSDSGVTWIKQVSNFNGGNGNVAGLVVNSSNILITTDAASDVWMSADSGITWNLIKEDYNGAEGNGADALAIDLNNALYILFNQAVWKSSDSGVTWTKIASDFDISDSHNGFSITTDSDNYVYIIDGNEDVYQSNNSGVNWTKLVINFNGGGGTVRAFTSVLLNTNLSFQVKNCSLPDCSDGNWKTSNLNNINLTGRYFQYKVIFTSPDSSITPVLESVSVDYNVINTAPVILIEYPQNSSYGISETLSLNFSVSDSDGNLGSCWYNINNGANISLLNCQNISLNLSPGSYTLNIYANDSYNLIGSDSVSFSVINSAPVINIARPQEGATYGYNTSLALNFSVSDNDGNLNSCWYNLDGGNNITLASCANTTFDVSGGGHILNIYANDSYNLIGSDSVSFSVSVGSPSIDLNFPINVYLNYNNIQFNYTPSDIDLQSCELWGNFNGVFEKNQTDTGVVSGQVNSFYLNLSDGIYLWNIKCVDNAGHSAFNGNKSFYVDTTNPSISLSEPAGAKTSKTIIASWVVSDASPVSCKYNVYRGVNLEITNTSVNCSENSANFDVTVDASFIFNFYVNDSAGNSNYKNSNFSVDTSIIPPTDDGGGGGGGGTLVSDLVPKEVAKIEVAKIGEIVVREGDKKTLSLNVKNTGTKFLNNCRLRASGEISSWVYSTQNEGIAPGQSVSFVFDINVPEEIEIKDYSGVLVVECEEVSDSQEISIIMPKTLQSIQVKELRHEDNGLNITYVFDNAKFIGEEASVEIWIVNEDGVEIERFGDVFSINKEGLIERNILIKLPDDLAGVYSVYFALSSDLDNYIKKSVVLGKPSTTGFAIFGGNRGRIVGYVIFVLITGIIIFFVIRKYTKKGEFEGFKSRGDKKSEKFWEAKKSDDSGHWFFGGK